MFYLHSPLPDLGQKGLPQLTAAVLAVHFSRMSRPASNRIKKALEEHPNSAVA
jgi:hypothetical protein